MPIKARLEIQMPIKARLDANGNAVLDLTFDDVEELIDYLSKYMAAYRAMESDLSCTDVPREEIDRKLGMPKAEWVKQIEDRLKRLEEASVIAINPASNADRPHSS